MYRGEIRKLLTPFNIILLAALMILNLFAVFYQHKDSLTGDGVLIREKVSELLDYYRNDPEKYDALLDDYNERKRKYDAERYQFLNDDGKQMLAFENKLIDVAGYGDIRLFGDVNAIISAPENYRANINSMLMNAAARYYDVSAGDVYLRQYYINLLKIYDPLAEIELPVEQVRGWNEFFSLKTPIIFLSLASLALYCQTFTVDKRAGMDILMHIYKKGSKPAVKAKLLFIVSTSAALTLIFTLTPLIIFAVFGGLSAPDIPMQLLSEFTYFRYELTVLQYLAVFCAVRVLVFVCLSLMLAFAGKLFQSEIPSVITLAVITAAGVILCQIPSESTAYWLYKFSPVNLAGVNILFDRYRGLHIFGGFGDYTRVMTGAMALLIAAICAAAILHRPRYAVKVRRERKLTAFVSIYISITGAEFYKLLIAESGIYILLGALIAKCLISAVYYNHAPASDELVYMDYIDEVAGEITDDKLAYISEEGEYIDSVLSEHTAVMTSYRNGELSGTEYSRHMGKYNYARYCESAYRRLEERKEYLVSASEQYENTAFLYERGIELFYDSPIDIAALLTFIVLLSRVFALEYDSGFYRVLRASKYGRKKVFASKLAFAVTLAAMINIIFLLVDIGFMARNYEVNYLNSSIMSIPGAGSIDMSILAFTAIKKVISFAGNIICALAITAISVLLEKQITAMVAVCMLIFIPIALKFYGIGFLDLINFAAITAPGEIASSIPALIILGLAVIALLYLSSRKWNGVYKSKQQ